MRYPGVVGGRTEVKKANVLEMTPRTWGCFGLRVGRGVGTCTRVASSGGTGNKPGTRLGSGITGNRHELSRDDLRWSGGCGQLDNIVRVRRVDVELRFSGLVTRAYVWAISKARKEWNEYPPWWGMCTELVRHPPAIFHPPFRIDLVQGFYSRNCLQASKLKCPSRPCSQATNEIVGSVKEFSPSSPADLTSEPFYTPSAATSAAGRLAP